MKPLRASGRPIMLDAIWPNVGVQVWYQQSLDTLINSALASLTIAITEIWPHVPKLFAQDAAPTNPTKRLQELLAKWSKETIKVFDLRAQPLAVEFAGKSGQATQSSMMAQLKKAGFTVKFKPTRKSIEAYRAVAAENVALIKSIPRKWHEQIEQQVWNAVRKGSDLSALSVELRKTYGSTLKRAALIARDQNAKAKATIERVRQMELGINRGVWMHSNAGKEPRILHLTWGQEQKVYDLSQGMWDEDEGEWVHPGELINCRCSMRPIIEGAEGDEEDEQPTFTLLRAALSNAERYDDPRYVRELRSLRNQRSDWKGQAALRREIDQLLRG